MKIVHVTEQVQDGAGRGAERIHRQLLAAGHESRFVTHRPPVVGPDGVALEWSPEASLSGAMLADLGRYLRARVGRMGRLRRSHPRDLFNLDLSFVRPSRLRTALAGAEVMMLYAQSPWLRVADWVAVCRALHLPVVQLVMDHEPLTGGCHFRADCERYTQGCGECPKLGRSGPGDLSASIFTAKREALAQASLIPLCVQDARIDSTIQGQHARDTKSSGRAV